MNYFPWIKSVQRAFSRTFPADYSSEALQYLQRNLEKEYENALECKDQKSLEHLFTSLREFYNHFCWKINWKKESNMKWSCVKILSLLIQTGVILSVENPFSKWMDIVLAAIKMFQGTFDLLCDALILVNRLKKSYHQAFYFVLKHLLLKRQLEVRSPSTYFKILILLRRLKFLTKDKMEKAQIVAVTAKIKVPSDTLSWLSKHGIRNCYKGNSTFIAKKLLNKNLSKVLVIKLREVLLEKYIDSADQANFSSDINSFFVINAVTSAKNNVTDGDSLLVEASKTEEIDTSNTELCDSDTKKYFTTFASTSPPINKRKLSVMESTVVNRKLLKSVDSKSSTILTNDNDFTINTENVCDHSTLDLLTITKDSQKEYPCSSVFVDEVNTYDSGTCFEISTQGNESAGESQNPHFDQCDLRSKKEKLDEISTSCENFIKLQNKKLENVLILNEESNTSVKAIISHEDAEKRIMEMEGKRDVEEASRLVCEKIEVIATFDEETKKHPDLEKSKINQVRHVIQDDKLKHDVGKDALCHFDVEVSEDPKIRFSMPTFEQISSDQVVEKLSLPLSSSKDESDSPSDEVRETACSDVNSSTESPTKGHSSSAILLEDASFEIRVEQQYNLSNRNSKKIMDTRDHEKNRNMLNKDNMSAQASTEHPVISNIRIYNDVAIESEKIEKNDSGEKHYETEEEITVSNSSNQISSDPGENHYKTGEEINVSNSSNQASSDPGEKHIESEKEITVNKLPNQVLNNPGKNHYEDGEEITVCNSLTQASSDLTGLFVQPQDIISATDDVRQNLSKENFLKELSIKRKTEKHSVLSDIKNQTENSIFNSAVIKTSSETESGSPKKEDSLKKAELEKCIASTGEHKMIHERELDSSKNYIEKVLFKLVDKVATRVDNAQNSSFEFLREKILKDDLTPCKSSKFNLVSLEADKQPFSTLKLENISSFSDVPRETTQETNFSCSPSDSKEESYTNYRDSWPEITDSPVAVLTSEFCDENESDENMCSDSSDSDNENLALVEMAGTSIEKNQAPLDESCLNHSPENIKNFQSENCISSPFNKSKCEKREIYSPPSHLQKFRSSDLDEMNASHIVTLNEIEVEHMDPPEHLNEHIDKDKKDVYLGDYSKSIIECGEQTLCLNKNSDSEEALVGSKESDIKFQNLLQKFSSSDLDEMNASHILTLNKTETEHMNLSEHLNEHIDKDKKDVCSGDYSKSVFESGEQTLCLNKNSGSEEAFVGSKEGDIKFIRKVDEKIPTESDIAVENDNCLKYQKTDFSSKSKLRGDNDLKISTSISFSSLEDNKQRTGSLSKVKSNVLPNDLSNLTESSKMEELDESSPVRNKMALNIQGATMRLNDKKIVPGFVLLSNQENLLTEAQIFEVREIEKPKTSVSSVNNVEQNIVLNPASAVEKVIENCSELQQADQDIHELCSTLEPHLVNISLVSKSSDSHQVRHLPSPLKNTESSSVIDSRATDIASESNLVTEHLKDVLLKSPTFSGRIDSSAGSEEKLPNQSKQPTDSPCSTKCLDTPLRMSLRNRTVGLKQLETTKSTSVRKKRTSTRLSKMPESDLNISTDLSKLTLNSPTSNKLGFQKDKVGVFKKAVAHLQTKEIENEECQTQSKPQAGYNLRSRRSLVLPGKLKLHHNK